MASATSRSLRPRTTSAGAASATQRQLVAAFAEGRDLVRILDGRAPVRRAARCATSSASFGPSAATVAVEPAIAIHRQVRRLEPDAANQGCAASSRASVASYDPSTVTTLGYPGTRERSPRASPSTVRYRKSVMKKSRSAVRTTIAELPVKLVRYEDVRQRRDDERVEPRDASFPPYGSAGDRLSEQAGRVRHGWRRSTALRGRRSSAAPRSRAQR